MTRNEKEFLARLAKDWMAESAKHMEASVFNNNEEEKSMHREASHIYMNCVEQLLDKLGEMKND